MDKIYKEVGPSDFENNILPKLLSSADLTKENLNSLKGEVRMAFVSGAQKLYKIDEGGRKIKEVNSDWLPGATHTLFEIATNPSEEVRKEKAFETRARVIDYIEKVGAGFPKDPTGPLKEILYPLEGGELVSLVGRK